MEALTAVCLAFRSNITTYRTTDLSRRVRRFYKVRWQAWKKEGGKKNKKKIPLACCSGSCSVVRFISSWWTARKQHACINLCMFACVSLKDLICRRGQAGQSLTPIRSRCLHMRMCTYAGWIDACVGCVAFSHSLEFRGTLINRRSNYKNNNNIICACKWIILLDWMIFTKISFFFFFLFLPWSSFRFLI